MMFRSTKSFPVDRAGYLAEVLRYLLLGYPLATASEASQLANAVRELHVQYGWVCEEALVIHGSGDNRSVAFQFSLARTDLHAVEVAAVKGYCDAVLAARCAVTISRRKDVISAPSESRRQNRGRR